MENKDIEKLLKESAEGVKIKDFSERWEKLKGRMDSAQESALEETTSETVLATSANGNLSQNSTKKKFIISLSAVFLLIIICLAIVLPITLRANDSPIDPPIDPPKFLELHELKNDGVLENEFYDKIAETDLKIVDIKNLEASNFTLLYTDENKLVGGSFEIIDENDGFYSSIVFYDSTVTSYFDVGADYKTYATNGVSIKYSSELTEDCYAIKAKAVKNDLNYNFDCLAMDENIENFFDKLFS